MVRDHADASDDIIAALRRVCLALPEVTEERAWVGRRWCVRKKNFAHVVPIADGFPPTYIKAAGTAGPTTVLTLRTSEPEFYKQSRAGERFFFPDWFPNLIGLRLDSPIDWIEVAELIEDSYRVLAPQRLIDLLP